MSNFHIHVTEADEIKARVLRHLLLDWQIISGELRLTEYYIKQGALYPSELLSAWKRFSSAIQDCCSDCGLYKYNANKP